MNNSLSKIFFYVISILLHAALFYILALNFEVLSFSPKEKKYQELAFQLTNPVIKKDPPPPPETKKAPPPKVISTVTEATTEPEEEVEAVEEVVQQIRNTIKTYNAFYKVDTRPSFKKRAPQHYPPLEKRAGKEGVVIVEADIDENGILQTAHIKKSAGENFDNSALKMIRNSTFNPGIKNGVNVPVRMRFTIRYKIQN